MTARCFTLTITTPSQIVVDRLAVSSIRAEDDSGAFGVHAGHADLVTLLSASVVRWRGEDGSEHYCAIDGGVLVVSGGTDCHMVLVDLRPKGVKGRDAEQALERAGLTCNKNAIPFDPEKPAVTSGVRLGTSAGTKRGFGEAQFRHIGKLILAVIDALADKGAAGDSEVEQAVLAEVRDLCRRFPIYS